MQEHIVPWTRIRPSWLARRAPEGTGNGTGHRDIEHERRRAIRHSCKAVVEMQVGYAIGGEDWSVDTVKVKGKVLDLSALGASLFTHSGFDKDQRLRVTIRLGDGADVKSDAVVCWNKPMPDKGGHASGAQFTNLSSDGKQRIVKFLQALEKSLGKG